MLAEKYGALLVILSKLQARSRPAVSTRFTSYAACRPNPVFATIKRFIYHG